MFKIVSVCFLCIIGLVLFLTNTSASVNTNLDRTTTNTFADHEINCLALNIYHEARGQNLAGQYAVALVTINRVDDNRYPNTICGVVHDGKYGPSWKDKNILVPIKNKCQFSWYCDGKPDIITDISSFERIKKLSTKIYYTNSHIDITNGATHYHNTSVVPRWAYSIIKTIKIDNHIFYRWENKK
jgi:spore germination cell wall hydrolase CwlJ-like protein